MFYTPRRLSNFFNVETTTRTAFSGRPKCRSANCTRDSPPPSRSPRLGRWSYESARGRSRLIDPDIRRISAKTHPPRPSANTASRTVVNYIRRRVLGLYIIGSVQHLIIPRFYIRWCFRVATWMWFYNITAPCIVYARCNKLYSTV